MTIRVCIGTEEKTEIPCKVLQHTILKHHRTSTDVEFFLSDSPSWQSTADRPFKIGTGFSLFRWQIPELLNYDGYAIYLDADQIVFKDIENLWRSDILFPNKDASVWCTRHPDNSRWETSVMFINCDKAKETWPSQKQITEWLANDPARQHYKDLMWAKKLATPPQQISDTWNHLNIYREGVTCLLHYTVEHQQPWYCPDHPLAYLWESALRDAIDDGFVTRQRIAYWLTRWKPATKTTRYEGLHPRYVKYG